MQQNELCLKRVYFLLSKKTSYMKLLSILALLLFTTLSIQIVSAQTKIGYADAELILSSLPETKGIEVSIQTYQKKLQEKLQIKDSYAKQKLQEYTELQAAGKLPEDEEKLAQQELQQLDKEIKDYIKEADAKLAAKRAELMQPLVKKVQDNIDEIGKKYNLTCIFNTVNNNGVYTLLHAPKENDLTTLLAIELGIETKNKGAEPIEPKGMIGYTNADFLFTESPEFNEMNKTFAAYQQKQTDKLAVKENYARDKMGEYTEKKEAKQLTEEEEKIYIQTLNSLNKEISEFRAQASQNVAAKRAELMNPVLAKIQATVDNIAKEKGYAYILNQATNGGLSSVLFGPKENDITAFAIQQLGEGTATKTNTPKKGEKVGFLNVESLLVSMPEIKGAEQELNKKTQELIKVISTKEGTYKTKVESFYTKEEAKQFGEGEREKLILEIQGLEKDLQQERQSAEETIQKYQQELTAPILKKLQANIDDVAKAGKFDFIQNITSDANLLYIQEGLNITPDLAKKLGLK